MMKYLIILFTRKDDLIHNNVTVDEFIAEAPDRLKTLLLACQHRFVAFNNRAPEEDRDQDVQSLLNAVDKMVVANRGRCYSNWIYVSASRIIEDRKEQLRLEHRIDVQNKKDYVKRKRKMKHEILAQLQQRLQDLKQERSDDSTESSEIYAVQQEIRGYEMMIEKHQRQYEVECRKEERVMANDMNLHFRDSFRDVMDMGTNRNISVRETGLKMLILEVKKTVSSILG
ncbi:GTPase IMAP family member 4-like [Haliotis rubra]|uniref:GTPase IMAP family member 4-like n=1 Tax=Haliotis rubra TaxID=36100 RepID=UPI001EE4FC6B|nr:GTPase IMAP family member 4-like [Haliotis rubra]